MRISDAYPSNYIKASDLRDKNVLVAIERIEMEDIGDDHKPVIYFLGHSKGLCLNKTNANNIATAYGDDTDDWLGKEIILYPTMVDFQGRSVAAIRVRAPNARDKANGSNGKRATPTQPPRDTRENDQQRHDHDTRGEARDFDDAPPF